MDGQLRESADEEEQSNGTSFCSLIHAPEEGEAVRPDSSDADNGWQKESKTAILCCRG